MHSGGLHAARASPARCDRVRTSHRCPCGLHPLCQLAHDLQLFADESVIDHAQRAWLWPAPQRGARHISESPFGADLMGKAPAPWRPAALPPEDCAGYGSPPARRHAAVRPPNRAFPRGRAYLFISPDRQSLSGSHGRRPWVYTRTNLADDRRSDRTYDGIRRFVPIRLATPRFASSAEARQDGKELSGCGEVRFCRRSAGAVLARLQATLGRLDGFSSCGVNRIGMRRLK